MHQFEDLSSSWTEMAKDVLVAARKRWSLEDYIRTIKLVEPKFGKSYLDRRNVLDLMLQHQIVCIADERLMLGQPDQSAWFSNLINNGSQKAWKLLDGYFPSEIVRKFDAEALMELGLAGEKWVVNEYTNCLKLHDSDLVKHVSLINDTLGFDIVTPSLILAGKDLHIEVKTTSRPGGKVSFYLSRNEFEVGMTDPRWVLLIVQMIDGDFTVFGHCFASQFETILPEDRVDFATWNSVKITLQTTDVVRGLP